MPEKPLLIFPEHTIAPRDMKKSRFGSQRYHLPSFQRQKDRLTLQFESMRQSFITDTTEGMEPEAVLVMEAIGKIEDFKRAVRAVPGLEWLAELDEEEVDPGNDFYQICKVGKRFFAEKIEDINAKQSSKIWHILHEKEFIDKDGYITGKDLNDFQQFVSDGFSEYDAEIVTAIKNELSETKKNIITGRLFLSMSNKQAMEELVSLWNQWTEKRGLRRPYGKWAEIFKHLKSLRQWNIQDRLRETGVVKYWEEELEIKRGTTSKILFEIEFWYRKDSNKRENIQKKVGKLISEENGKIITSSTIEEICFHAIKAELPPENLQRVINNEYTRLFKSDEVMFFRPVGQCGVVAYPEGEEGDFEPGSVSGDPVVAVLDGVPFSAHSLLENRLILDDPDDFASTYQARERKHGTAMASLVCHGELDAKEEPLLRPVYFRPIMKPDPDDFINSSRIERIPKEQFWEDLIERSVRRMFEGDGEAAAVAATVQIINLSIGDTTKMFFRQLSSMAKLLDWLSYKYQVLFCISAGNIVADIDLEMNEIEIKAIADNELSRVTMQKIHNDIRNRKIFSPAEAINAMTIGATHTDKSSIANLGNRINIFPNQALPSPVSAHGYGFRNSINPEIYLPGGRQLYNYDYVDRKYKISNSGEAPGQRVATAPVTLGEMNRCVYTRGTSNATALATRGAAQIFEALDALKKENAYKLDDENIAVLLKTLLVHSASWGDVYDVLEDYLKNKTNSRNFKKIVSRYIGYGILDTDRVLECTAQRATAIGYGKIKKDEKHNFRFPLPPSLSGSNEMRRLVITLAWFSPINANSRKFRKANLSFLPPKDDIGVERKNADWQQVKNGTVQHEILEGKKSISYQDGDALVVSVVCREDAGNLDESVNYGLAVTLEVAEEVGLPIYEEIKDRISVPVALEEEI